MMWERFTQIISQNTTNVIIVLVSYLVLFLISGTVSGLLVWYSDSDLFSWVTLLAGGFLAIGIFLYQRFEKKKRREFSLEMLATDYHAFQKHFSKLESLYNDTKWVNANIDEIIKESSYLTIWADSIEKHVLTFANDLDAGLIRITHILVKYVPYLEKSLRNNDIESSKVIFSDILQRKEKFEELFISMDPSPVDLFGASLHKFSDGKTWPIEKHMEYQFYGKNMKQKDYEPSSK